MENLKIFLSALYTMACVPLLSVATFNDYNQFISAEKDVMEEKAIEQGILVEANNEAQATIKAFLSLVPGMNNYKLTVKTSGN